MRRGIVPLSESFRESSNRIQPTTRPMPTPIAVLILAAGQASRMGRPKQLLPWGDTTLVGHAVRRAQGLPGAQVYVVTGAHAKQVAEALRHFGVRFFHNSDYKSGMASSIAAGVAAIRKEQPEVAQLLIALADQPFIPTSYLQTLLDRQRKIAAPVATAYSAERTGVPAVFGPDSFAALENLEGDRGARLLLRTANVVRLEPPQWQLRDIDTPEAYERYRREIGKD